VPKLNATYINKLNKIKVLELIRKERSISRADIAKVTRLSAPTITRIVESLINNEKLVIDLGLGSSEGGRPPNLVSFASQARFIIGIDIGRTNISAALSDLDAKIIQEDKEQTGADEGYEKVIARVVAMIEKLIKRSRVNRRDIMGVGLAIGGLMDRKHAIIEFSPDFQWRNVDPATTLSKAVGLPVMMDNVTRVAAIGELHYGIGEKYRNFICINVGYGIGAGIIIDGQPFYGSHGISGEFGHIVVAKDDERICNCGNRGCLEAIASGYGIARMVKERISNGELSEVTRLCGGDLTTISAAMVADAANQGDLLSRDVLREAMEYLSIGVANLITLFDPEAIVLSGRVALSGDNVLAPLRSAVGSRSINFNRKDIYIGLATYGQRAAVMGALALILNEVLNLKLTVTADKGLDRE
jgi:glucokinase-like ROK family protein